MNHGWSLNIKAIFKLELRWYDNMYAAFKKGSHLEVLHLI